MTPRRWTLIVILIASLLAVSAVGEVGAVETLLLITLFIGWVVAFLTWAKRERSG